MSFYCALILYIQETKLVVLLKIGGIRAADAKMTAPLPKTYVTFECFCLFDIIVLLKLIF